MQLPTEIYDLITFHVQNADYPYEINTDISPENRPRRQLAKLRLVNQAFCPSATRHLFRHIVIRLYGRASTIRAFPPLVRLIEISKSPLAQHVRELEIKFEGPSNRVGDRPDLENFAAILSPCLARFTNLKKLSFETPRMFFSREDPRSYINTVVMAICNVPLPNLVGLVLHFPICHDFGQFFSSSLNPAHIPITTILRQLRSLELEVCAYASSRGRGYARMPALPQHLAFPNETYACYLHQMLEPAINLTSLSLSSKDILNLDPVHFSSSLQLQSLSLSGVSISARTLLALIHQSSSTLESISLNLVKLNSQTWEDVLLEIAKLQHLTEFSVESGGYSSTGASAHLATGTPRRNRKPNIETHSKGDLVALGALQCAVNTNRVKAGLEPYGTNYYMYIDTVPEIDQFRAFYF
ncbi:uncharacterized protein BHQ10_005222 [Talaromyces amestolkiae]|uniref:F-box domain-containing protein n=1 Tax=Talaromyces amestolkiae TaxID=1196081 RepID=A0A364L082_TALAM|nr:uncharacterized protein BHQ10_005222 [Talaromyces amestolkiae]RAO69210.1 hypothetical protein BHQ10_005222 [Talaromyces amestolkiae]